MGKERDLKLKKKEEEEEKIVTRNGRFGNSP